MASKKIVSAAAAVATVAATLSPAFAANFTDVKSDATYAKSANRLKALGIVSGDAKGNFNPDDNLQRDQAAKLLVGALAQNNAAAGENKFSDVSGWATKFVNIAAAQGYVKGYGNGKFGPADKVTNGQFLAMALRALGKDDAALGLDAKTKWADKVTKYLAAAKDAKLIDGLDNLDPAATAKRSDVAVIVNNLLNSDVDGSTLYENVKKDLGVQVVNGTVDSVDANTVVVAGKAYTADTVPDKVKAGAIVKFDAKDDTAVSDITVVKEAQTVVNANYNAISVSGVDNTTVKVVFDSKLGNINASDFTIVGATSSLSVTAVKVDGNVATLTTSSQKDETYTVSYNARVAGQFKGQLPTGDAAIKATSLSLSTLSVYKPGADIKTATADQTVAVATYGTKVQQSVQAVTGGSVIVKALATPGSTITFRAVPPVGSLNQSASQDVVAGADGVATFTLSRTNADSDTVFVTAKGNEGVVPQQIAKVYWGVAPILVMEKTSTPDATATAKNTGDIVNNKNVTFKVTLKNPVTGQPVADKTLKVMFRENIESQTSTATATSSFDTRQVRPYQIPGYQDTLLVKTDVNGVATFTATGSNTKVTPVVFFDDPIFFSNNTSNTTNSSTQSNNYSTTLTDSTQYLASFAGNNNNRFDGIELSAEIPTVNFGVESYKFAGAAAVAADESTDMPAIAADTESVQKAVNATYDFDNYGGRTYTIQVTKPTGGNFAGGWVNIGFNELLGSNYQDTRARFLTVNGTQIDRSSDVAVLDRDSVGVKHFKVKLNNDGKATFTIASSRENDIATPILWVDQDTTGLYSGNTNDKLDVSLDSYTTLGSTTFVKRVVKYVRYVSSTNDAVDGTVGDGGAKDTTSKSDGVNKTITLAYRFYDQNDKLYTDGKNARVTFTFTNTGSKTVRITNNPDNIVDPSTVTNMANSRYITKESETSAYNGEGAWKDIFVKPGYTATVSGILLSGKTEAKLFVRGDVDEALVGGGVISTTAKSDMYTDAFNNLTQDHLYLEPLPAPTTATFGARVYDAIEVAGATNQYYYGTVSDFDLKNRKFKVNLPGNRFIWVRYDNLGTEKGKFDAGSNNIRIKSAKLQQVNKTDNLNIADFNAAVTIISDVNNGNDVTPDPDKTSDLNGLNWYQKLVNILKSGGAANVRVSLSAVDEVTKVHPINELAVLYTTDVANATDYKNDGVVAAATKVTSATVIGPNRIQVSFDGTIKPWLFPSTGDQNIGGVVNAVSPWLIGFSVDGPYSSVAKLKMSLVGNGVYAGDTRSRDTDASTMNIDVDIDGVKAPAYNLVGSNIYVPGYGWATIGGTNAPKVVSAVLTDEDKDVLASNDTLKVTFSTNVDFTNVDAGDFALISNGIMFRAKSISVIGNVATLKFDNALQLSNNNDIFLNYSKLNDATHLDAIKNIYDGSEVAPIRQAVNLTPATIVNNIIATNSNLAGTTATVDSATGNIAVTFANPATTDVTSVNLGSQYAGGTVTVGGTPVSVSSTGVLTLPADVVKALDTDNDGKVQADEFKARIVGPDATVTVKDVNGNTQTFKLSVN